MNPTVAGANPNITTPRILVIGLGSTGSQICDAVIERLEDVYEGGLTQTPWVKCLVLETEQADTAKASARTGNYFQLQVDPNMINEAKRTPQSLDTANDFSTWTIDTIRDRWQPGPGAGNTRMIGRMTLLHPEVLPIVVAKITDSLDALNLLPQRFIGPGGVARATAPQSPIDVFLCGTLVGGTASGGIVDLGFILESLPGYAGKLNIVGVISVPSTTLAVNHLKANAYQALTELSHFYFPGTLYKQRVPLQHIAGGVIDAAPGTRPFDSVFLVQPRGGTKDEELRLMVASSAQLLLSFALTESAGTVRAKLVNPGTVYSGKLDRRGRPQDFNSFGVSVIEYPIERIEHGCSARLVAEALDGWLKRADFDPNQGRNFFVNRLGLTNSKLLDDLVSNASQGESFDQRFRSVAGAFIDSARTEGSAELAALTQVMEVGFDHTKVDTGRGVKAGEFSQNVVNREKEVTEQRVGAVKALLGDMITDGLRGPNWVLESITVWKQQIEREMADLDALVDSSIIDGYKNEMDEHALWLDQTLGSTLITVLGWKKVAADRILKEYTESASTYWSMRLKQVAAVTIRKVYSAVAEVMDRVSIRLNDPQFGLVQWAQEMRTQLEKLYTDDRDLQVPINGFSDFSEGPGMTLDQEYAQILKVIPRPTRTQIPENGTSPEQYHKLCFFEDWKEILPGDRQVQFLREATVDALASKFDRRAQGAQANSKPTPADIQAVLRVVRGKFNGELRTRNIADRLVRQGLLPEVVNVVQAGSPFIVVNDIDTSNGAPAGADIRIPNFAFINGGDSAVGVPEEQVRQQIGPVNWTYTDSGTPHRITIIRARAVFSAHAVSAVAGFQQFWDNGKETMSRQDVQWRRMDGTDPIPQFGLRMSTVLVAIGLGVIRHAGGFRLKVPAGQPGVPAQELHLEDSIDEIAISLDRKNMSAWLTEEIRKEIERIGQHETAVQLNNFAASFATQQFMPARWHGAPIGQSGNLDAGVNAVRLMKLCVNTIPGLWVAWKGLIQIPATVGYILIPASNEIGGGYECKLCHTYLGAQTELATVSTLSHCPGCGAELQPF